MNQTTDTSLSRYIALVHSFPKLTRAEELTMWRRWRGDGDELARDNLVRSNLRYVVAIALKYRNYSIPVSELIAEGNFGIIQALNKFEPERGNRFVTYAACWIRAFIITSILQSWSLVGGGSGPLHSRMFFRLRRERTRIHNLVGEGERADTLLAERVGIPVERVAEFYQRLAHRDVSLDQQVFRDGTTTLIETLPSPASNQEQAYEDLQDEQRLGAMIHHALSTLDAREKLVIEANLMSDEDDKLSLADFGRRLGVSRERVRQLEVRAKRKLRQYILEMSKRHRVDDQSVDSAA